MITFEESCSILGIEDIYSFDKLDEKEIKKKYKRLMVKYHPDSPTGDTEKATELTDAYNIVIKTIKELKLLSTYTSKEQITTVLDLDKLIRMYKGETAKLKSTDKTRELKANELSSHNIFINVAIEMQYNGEVRQFNEINKYNMMDNYTCNCKIFQDNISEPLALKVRCCNITRELTISSANVDLIMNLDSGIKITIQIERKIISEN